MENNLSLFFSPAGVAVIGASSNPAKLSHGILKNLTMYGYQGKIYPVNPRTDKILDLESYPDITSVPEPLELAVIVLPAQAIPDVIKACGERGVKAVIIISGGFKEIGEEGIVLEQECLAIARSYGMRLIGPNCVGTLDLYSGLNTTFIDGVPERGGIGFLSQSGAILGGIVNLVREKHVGFSHFISLGNEADVSETDIIEYLGDDPNVRVITAYIEAIIDGPRFIEVVKQVTRKKPVVILKAGRSSAGARAVSSHTGSLAGSHDAYQAAFEECGIIEAETMVDLFNISIALDYQPLPPGNRAVILTNAGGPAALCSDSLSAHEIQLEDLEPETETFLRKHLNPSAQVANPVDMLGGATPEEYELTLKRLLEDNSVDIIIPIQVPQAITDPADIAREMVIAAEGTHKTILSCFIGDQIVSEARKVLHENRIPMYIYPDNIGQVLGAMNKYSDWISRPLMEPTTVTGIQHRQAQEILDKNGVHSSMGEAETRPLLQAYGISVISGEKACSAEEAAEIANRIGYPVALKIVSPELLHKSDAGGIKLDLKSAGAVNITFQSMIKEISNNYPYATLEGALVEAMAPAGEEVIIGMKRDPNFGPVIMFGLGGIYVELFKDVTFSIAPVCRKRAWEMIRNTAAGKLLSGFRGRPRCDLDAVVDCILRISQLSLDFPQIEEIEINPLRVMPVGAVALDSRVILRKI
jgi:acetate---CoA ligase (ADP-forming)